MRMDIESRTFVDVRGNVGTHIEFEDDVFEAMDTAEVTLVRQARAILHQQIEQWVAGLRDVPLQGVLSPFVEAGEGETVSIHLKVLPVISRCGRVWRTCGSCITSEEALAILVRDVN
jgi:hypothetical protein